MRGGGQWRRMQQCVYRPPPRSPWRPWPFPTSAWTPTCSMSRWLSARAGRIKARRQSRLWKLRLSRLQIRRRPCSIPCVHPSAPEDIPSHATLLASMRRRARVARTVPTVITATSALGRSPSPRIATPVLPDALASPGRAAASEVSTTRFAPYHSGLQMPSFGLVPDHRNGLHIELNNYYRLHRYYAAPRAFWANPLVHGCRRESFCTFSFGFMQDKHGIMPNRYRHGLANCIAKRKLALASSQQQFQSVSGASFTGLPRNTPPIFSVYSISAGRGCSHCANCPSVVRLPSTRVLHG